MSHLLAPVSLAVISPLVSVLAVLFAIVSALMMLIILVQKPKGGGLSGAFGGAGGSEGAFVGARVGDLLTLVTASCFVVFVLLAMGLTWTTTPPEAVADDAFVAETPATTAPAGPSPEAGGAVEAAEGVEGPPPEAASADPAAGEDGATPITPTVGDDPDSATANNANREPVAADVTAHDQVDAVLDAVAGQSEADE